MKTADILNRVRTSREADLRDIHQATSIPLARLQKIRYGQTADPKASTVDALRDYFESRGAGASSG